MTEVATLVSSTAEKGWGMYFDAKVGGVEHRFSISGTTLASPVLHRSSRMFPEIFDSNLPLILRAAAMLVQSGRLETKIDIGGTEIHVSHLEEAQRHARC
ncbi:hypothetical protein [Stutzerimonas nosocomialis]|uniref:hypothetical protein n=1 Tax=Stutzerimonas nosocomialis TaxID=1056496 RepID=UPI001109D58B|nr:hypothetical protein [Stutzerimonas nosocomialis]